MTIEHERDRGPMTANDLGMADHIDRRLEKFADVDIELVCRLGADAAAHQGGVAMSFYALSANILIADPRRREGAKGVFATATLKLQLRQEPVIDHDQVPLIPSADMAARAWKRSLLTSEPDGTNPHFCSALCLPAGRLYRSQQVRDHCTGGVPMTSPTDAIRDAVRSVTKDWANPVWCPFIQDSQGCQPHSAGKNAGEEGFRSMSDLDFRPVTLILSADAAQDLYDALTVARHRRECGPIAVQPNRGHDVTAHAPRRRAKPRREAVSAGSSPASA